MNNPFKNLVMVVTVIALLSFISTFNKEISLVESTSFLSGVGYDFDAATKNKYTISVAIYNFKSDHKSKSVVLDSTITDLSLYKYDIQNKNASIYESGTEKLYVISTRLGTKGIDNLISLLMNDSQVSMRTLIATTDNSPKDILNYNNIDYKSAADYIEKNLTDLSQRQFNNHPTMLFDVCKQNKNEGYTCIIPNINLDNGMPTIKDYCVFFKGKLVDRIPMNSIIYVNMLRNNSSSGKFIYSKDENTSLTYNCDVNRKVTSVKQNGKVTFKIDLTITAILNNGNLNGELIPTLEEKKKEEKETSQYIANRINELIKNMQSNSKLDLFNLSPYLIAKYGETSATDWNSVVSNSTIDVSVNFKIDKLSLSNYK